MPIIGFSDDIFKDMSIEDLKTEYHRTKRDRLKYKAEILKYNLVESRVRYFLEQQDRKMKSVKQHLNSLLMKARIYKVHHTGDAFDKLQ